MPATQIAIAPPPTSNLRHHNNSAVVHVVCVARAADPSEGGGRRNSAGGTGQVTKIKEKNRLAQQRFRQKQKNMVNTIKERLGELEEQVGDQRA